MKPPTCLAVLKLIGICVLCGTYPVMAEESLATVRTALSKGTPDLAVEDLEASPVKGLYQVVLGGTSGYVTEDGRYFIPGDLYEVQSRKNVTQEARNAPRLALLKKADLKDAILFAPAHTKHTITVFTDVDCGYCRKLHGEIAKYNELGITVRYVAYPRSGPNTESWATMEAVWCSPDRRDALTRAKRGEKIQKPASCVAPVAAHYALGGKVGVQGTPLILLEDGSVIGGYMPAEQLAKHLESLGTQKTAAANQR